MERLETRLRAEGFYFPTREQLTAILYNESFGFRWEHPEGLASFMVDNRRLTPAEAHQLIRNSRLANALVVINRVRQRVGRRPGWTETISVPRGQRGTAPAQRQNEPGYSLALAGNQDAWDECFAVAEEALQRKLQPLNSLQRGCQFYSHTDSRGTSTILADHVPVQDHIGPLYSPHRRPVNFRYLQVAFQHSIYEAAIRWEQEAVSRYLEPFGVNTR